MHLNEDHIIDFVMKRWDLKKKDIAEKYLNCDPAKLSRKPLREKPEMLYGALFDIENQLSAAYKENKAELLGALKVFIVELGFQETLADIWDADYKIFVKELLRRAHRQPHKGKSFTRKENSITLEHNKGENVSQNETPSQHMLNTFVKVYCDCRISEFICSDLFMGIDPNSITWVDRFLKSIESDVMYMFEHDQTEIMYKKISQFTNAMREYKDYLVNNMGLWEHDTTKLYVKYENQVEKDEFEKSTKYYRKRIFSLYQEICDGNIFFTGLKF